MVSLILFDCDGTLVDSQYVIIETMNRAFRTKNMAPPTWQPTLRLDTLVFGLLTVYWVIVTGASARYARAASLAV